MHLKYWNCSKHNVIPLVVRLCISMAEEYAPYEMARNSKKIWNSAKQERYFPIYVLFYICSCEAIKAGAKVIDYRKSIQENLDYIEDNLKTPITATELCKQAGYSLFHYYRLFQSAVGMSVMQYILRRRLIHAIYEIRCGCKRINLWRLPREQWRKK